MCIVYTVYGIVAKWYVVVETSVTVYCDKGKHSVDVTYTQQTDESFECMLVCHMTHGKTSIEPNSI